MITFSSILPRGAAAFQVFLLLVTSQALVVIQKLREIGSNALSPKGDTSSWRNSVSPIEVNSHVYQTVVPLTKEVEYAGKALLHLRGQYTLATKQISKGKDFDYRSLKDSVADMVNSVVRCPDAFTWLLRLRMKDQHTHDHSMRSALWAVQFARHIGMKKEDMSILCMGTLLKDIGKIKLPNSLLRKKIRLLKTSSYTRALSAMA